MTSVNAPLAYNLMAEEPPTTISNDWNLDAARRLLRAFTISPPASDVPDNIVDSTIDELDPSAFDPTTSKSTSLGDFDRLWRFRGLPTTGHLQRSRHDSTESSSSARSDGSTAPSSVGSPSKDTHSTGKRPGADVIDEGENVEEFVRSPKAVHWKVDAVLELPKTRKRSAQVSAVDLDKLRELLQTNDGTLDNLLHSTTASRETEVQSEHPPPSFHNTLVSARRHGLLPAALPHSPPRFSPTPASFLDTRLIRPLLTLTATEKKAYLVRILQQKKLLAQDFDATRAVANWGGNIRLDGIHVFVDLSNINIGFINELKKVRKMGGGNRSKMPPIDFHSLAFILERGRPVARRVLAGSHGGIFCGQHARRPEHMYDAERCGYEMNILERVYKIKPPIFVKKNLRGTGNGYATASGRSSGSDAPVVATPVEQEQCVDEILHLKMLESLLDFKEPSTLVLASGDAAEAEYSGGFFKYVEKYLQKGWTVELVSWSDSMSWQYRSKSFLNKWNTKFRVIELDSFSEALLAMHTERFSDKMLRARAAL
jgi:hypothetical protein